MSYEMFDESDDDKVIPWTALASSQSKSQIKRMLKSIRLHLVLIRVMPGFLAKVEGVSQSITVFSSK